MQPIKVMLDEATRHFYVQTLTILNESGLPYLVGGAYAMGTLAEIERHTKDLDIFVRLTDRDRILQALASHRYHTEVTFPHWLAKAWVVEEFIDVIYSSGNGAAPVDDEWFEHAVDAELLGIPVKLCPPEEIIWSKSFVQERERFDGADIAHLIRKSGSGFNWLRLLRRFGDHWRVLLSHLINFGYIYPGERDVVPDWVMAELIDRLSRESREPAPREKVCRGTLLSREQYLIDVAVWGYRDGRLEPEGAMSPESIDHWTAAIATK